jgi:histone H3/H4
MEYWNDISETQLKKGVNMNNLLNQSAAHKVAKSLEIRLGASGIKALNNRIGEILKEASVKAQKARRKTILERDVTYEKDLFS